MQAGHKYLNWRMLAQLLRDRAGFLSNLGQTAHPVRSLSRAEKAHLTHVPRRSPLTCYNQRFPMADIRPFRALRYNQEKVTASQVVTQPYDKITPAMQKKYYAASPFNLVRIILGLPEASDNTTDNVYSRAAGFSRHWREGGILRQDSASSIYPYSQVFTSPSGKKFER